MRNIVSDDLIVNNLIHIPNYWKTAVSGGKGGYNGRSLHLSCRIGFL
ncbi:hypothetical protein NEIMUCOT_04153 [Neisseria mucosa ATCC 25996]|uniref:Uncharacterized protein n=1 Tax=Neisseria mucosa (strain ATCC 25996 / DSM 4631 / NCTC 10774 / M26) TaxID=546266 RepID=D2ZU65_NEIM2|nr:hypothetical protein NEIMUCOT_04153 [Neisseria mucosa ATCC 25996]